MSAPSWEEMEAKRQEMITSFKDIATAMKKCVAVIEDYARLSPSTLGSIPTEISNLNSVDPSLLNKPSNPPKQATGTKAQKNTASNEEVNGDGKVIKKKEKKEKKIKDPNAPKRPPSAYLLFQNDVREEIKQGNPGMVYKDVLAKISERWKSLPIDEKKVYEDAYNDAQKQFEQKGIAYTKAQADAADVTAAALAAVNPTAQDSDSDSDSSDSDDTPPTTIAPAAMKAPVIPPTLAQIAPPPKKERKRKSKEEGTVPAAVDGEKKKKKSKE